MPSTPADSLRSGFAKVNRYESAGYFAARQGLHRHAGRRRRHHVCRRRGALHAREAPGRLSLARARRRARRNRHDNRRDRSRRLPVPDLRRGDAALRAQPGQGARVPGRGPGQRRPPTNCAKRASAFPPAGRPSPASRNPDEQMEKGCSRASPIGCSPAKASSRATSRSAAPNSGAGKRQPSTCAGSRSSRARWAIWSFSGEAQARRAPPEPRRQRVLHERLRRGARRDARRVRLGTGRQHQRRPRRANRAASRAGVSTLARHVLRDGHVGAGIHAEPARGQDRRPRRVRRSDGARRHPAQPVRAEQRRVPHRRDQQRLLRPAAGEPVSRRSTSPRRISASSRKSRPTTSRSTSRRRAHEPRPLGRRRRERQAQSAAAGHPRRRGDLRPPEHGRRRLRHRRGAARVRRTAGNDAASQRRLSRTASSRANRWPTR